MDNHKRNSNIWGYEFQLTSRKEIAGKDKEKHSETVYLRTYFEKYQFDKSVFGRSVRGKPLKRMTDIAAMAVAIFAMIASVSKLAAAVLTVLE
jgi:hypothetical protein